jgi:hypothetical protein
MLERKRSDVTSTSEGWTPLTQNWYDGRSLPRRLIVVSPEGEANLEAMKEYNLTKQDDIWHHETIYSGGSAIIAICFPLQEHATLSFRLFFNSRRKYIT